MLTSAVSRKGPPQLSPVGSRSSQSTGPSVNAAQGSAECTMHELLEGRRHRPALRGGRKGRDAELLADAVVVNRVLRALRRVTGCALRLVAVRSQAVSGGGLGADQLATELVDLLLQRCCMRL